MSFIRDSVRSFLSTSPIQRGSTSKSKQHRGRQGSPSQSQLYVEQQQQYEDQYDSNSEQESPISDDEISSSDYTRFIQQREQIDTPICYRSVVDSNRQYQIVGSISSPKRRQEGFTTHHIKYQPASPIDIPFSSHRPNTANMSFIIPVQDESLYSKGLGHRSKRNLIESRRNHQRR